MCEYCERLTEDHKMDGHGLRHVLPLHMDVSSTDTDTEETESIGCITEPTPVSMRRHRDDGLTSAIWIYHADDHGRVTNFSIPIRYCPICGRELGQTTEGNG